MMAWALLAGAGLSSAEADEYPAKPIPLIVGFTAGAAGDVLARVVAADMGKQLGQTIVVEDKPGAGSNIAAEYVAQQFQKAGLKPAGENGFIQPVKFVGRKLVEPESSLELIRNGKVERLTLGEDAIIGRGTPPAPSIEAPLVFAGYGLTVPEMKFDDFAGLDVRGKIIVVFGGGPSNIPGALKAHY